MPWADTEHVQIKTEIVDGRITMFDVWMKKANKRKQFKVGKDNDIVGTFKKVEQWCGLIEV